MFPWYLWFSWRDLYFPILLFSSISLHWSLRKASLSLLAILWNSAFRWGAQRLSITWHTSQLKWTYDLFTVSTLIFVILYKISNNYLGLAISSSAANPVAMHWCTACKFFFSSFFHTAFSTHSLICHLLEPTAPLAVHICMYKVFDLSLTLSREISMWISVIHEGKMLPNTSVLYSL